MGTTFEAGIETGRVVPPARDSPLHFELKRRRGREEAESPVPANGNAIGHLTVVVQIHDPAGKKTPPDHAGAPFSTALSAAQCKRVASLLRGCTEELSRQAPQLFESRRTKEAAAIARDNFPVILRAIENMALASRNAQFRDRVRAHPALDTIRGFGADDVVAHPKKKRRDKRHEDSQEASPSQPDGAEDSQMSTMDDWL
ncbi:hypothetical protein M885DRAFT_506417 [Pelagophyceae sp. CCMP2097]|nr:hypothetical protein M885DRAFT_506417 [Pelagophyceae sp. CCMP2097]